MKRRVCTCRLCYSTRPCLCDCGMGALDSWRLPPDRTFTIKASDLVPREVPPSKTTITLPDDNAMRPEAV